jgi:hypothetical protein
VIEKEQELSPVVRDEKTDYFFEKSSEEEEKLALLDKRKFVSKLIRHPREP